MSAQKLLIITGLQRSSTTIVGEIVRRAQPNVTVLHEPLNPKFGVRDVPSSYPCVQDSASEYAPFIDNVIGMRSQWSNNAWKGRRAQSGSVMRRVAVRLTGGKSSVRWRLLRAQAGAGLSPAVLCWKDPFVTLAIPYLTSRWDARTVCMVRHPAAIHVSNQKQGWRVPISHLTQQRDLMSSYRGLIPEEHWQLAERSDAASIAILWKLMVSMLLPLSREDNRIKLVLHETLCLNPEATVDDILSHLDLHGGARVQEFIKQKFHGHSIEGTKGRVHDFERDSRMLADSWRGKISAADEQVIIQIAGSELTQLYSR